jgi:CheY-like chemotaxis protein
MNPSEVLLGRRILIVEDEYLVAETLSDVLSEAGASLYGPIGWVDEAVAFVQQNDALIERGVRFVFITGYDGAALDAAYQHHPRCEKPFQVQAILAALATA